MKQLVLISPKDFAAKLLAEITADQTSKLLYHKDRLFWINTNRLQWVWAQNIWLQPEILEFSSASDAARQLRDRHPLWFHHSTNHHRRAELIVEKLPKIKTKPLDFPVAIKFPPLGAFTLLEPNRLLLSAGTTSPFADGDLNFKVDEVNPPSRAHLKLWEFFTLQGKTPKRGSHCLDMGSSPGGWTWVLSNLGLKVTSVDRAELEAPLMRNKLVTHLKRDAFTLEPDAVKNLDWFFSDIICYPDRLFDLVGKWRKAKPKLNFVCTIKFQGDTDFASVNKFLEIPGSTVQHLSANRNEVTWSLLVQE